MSVRDGIGKSDMRGKCRKLRFAGAVLFGVAMMCVALQNVRGQGQAEADQNLTYSRGQSVIPVFDGWHPNPDGTIDIWFGYLNYLRGFGSFRLPSGTPIASLYAAIPLSGALIALFTVEQLVNGVRNGFDHPEPPEIDRDIPPADAAVPTRAQP